MQELLIGHVWHELVHKGSDILHMVFGMVTSHCHTAVASAGDNVAQKQLEKYVCCCV